ncbi:MULTISPECIES: DUF413 domain-containing protein [unclassified Oleiphilus]|jgi:uncharacterized protein YifE (UPF0438 family)|uniref:DUF413 domain-containing protein n=1 Tax=unclassified Oleiphilus TaxID=2631174 RepID=UPI0007C1FE44|nr:MULTISPECIES: DUF413 domain-containing protein [unclassified Oleiphilus]KZY48565.1 hypothetical protein A3732_05795 [Oleiphilus sp. HI0050]KZY76425.1 hypothetical protein A3740_12905 [Oleiphilus sp. HI0068]KZY85184.1 hypothetical protein A3741_15625 [Oleiphilus sp. HI0069]KZY96321.1 hypothetical protein A3743_04685 [Oleiphilus sp. HI0072]KZZ20095.1 hypothetical protein A3752_12730 [Oleiphilus sp. HI0081]KZZ47444.1 hypothetical protein A3755_15570 [Oleiphilus sp. HI0085]
MANKQAFHTTGKFWAIEHFPKGIARSGHFTKEQAQLLEDYGKSYKALYGGELKPRCDEEKEFVSVFMGKKEASSIHERAWKRFLEVSNQRQRLHISMGAQPSSSVDFSSYDDDSNLSD